MAKLMECNKSSPKKEVRVMNAYIKKITQIGKPLARLRKKRVKSQINKIRYGMGNIITETTDIQRIMRLL